MDLAAYLNTVGLPEELWDAFVDKVERGELGCSQLMVDAASGATVAVGAIAPQGDVWLLPNTACTTKSRLRALINDDNGSGLRPQLASMAAGGPLEAALEAAFWRHCKPALPRPGRGQIDETEWYIEHPLAASMKHSSAAPVAVLAPLPHSVAAELPSAAATATAASASAAGPEPQQQCQQSLEQRGVVMLWFVGHVVAGQCVSRDWVAPCSSSATLPRAGSLAWALRQLVLVAPQRWMNAQVRMCHALPKDFDACLSVSGIKRHGLIAVAARRPKSPL